MVGQQDAETCVLSAARRAPGVTGSADVRIVDGDGAASVDQVKVAMASSPGHLPHPNEDFVGAVPGAVVLLDGAGIRGTEYICYHGVEWYSHTLGSALLSRLSRQSPGTPKAVLADAIDEVANSHRRTCDIANPSSPQATVVIVQFAEATTNFLVLADAFLILESSDGPPEVVTDPREVANRVECTQQLNGLLPGTPPYDVSRKAAILELQARRNTRDGYWIAKDDPAAAAEAVIGSTPLATLRSATPMSNGASRFVEPYRLADWSATLHLLRTSGPDALLARLRDAEADPATPVTPLPGSSASDDATVAYCQPHD